MADEENKKEEEDIEIDFKEIGRKIKGWFKQKETKEVDDDNIDLSEAVKFIKENKRIIFYAILIGIISVGTWLRSVSVPHYNGILVGLDEFLFHRYGTYIINNGTLPEIDTLRYFPTGFKTYQEQQVLSYMIAGFYHILRAFNPSIQPMEATIWLPVAGFFISMIFFYLMVLELTNKKTALIATTFLCFVPSYLFRTLAGVTDKESVAMIFWFSMVWALIKSLKAKKMKEILIWGLASGLIGGLNALTWGGANFLFHSVATTFLILLVINKITIKQELTYYTWFIPMILMNVLLTERYGDILTHDIFISSVVTAIAIFFKELVYNLYINKLKKKKYADSIYFFRLMIIFAIAGLIALQITGLFDVISKYNSAIETIKNPFGTCAFCVSVTENQAPYFYDPSRGVDWWHNLNWFIPLFVIGGSLMVYESFKKFGKDALMIVGLFTLFIIFFMFSKFVNSSGYEAANNFFANTYLYTLPALLIIMVLFFITHARKTAWNELTPSRLIMIFWFALSVVATRGAIRIVFASTPIFMIMSAYCITKLKDLINDHFKDKVYSYSVYALAVIITLIAFNATSASAAQFYTSFTPNWVESMNWVKANTSSDAVFTHWWDYGYWVQTMGERTTTVDGGNFYAELNEIIGGRMFSGYNLTEVYYSLDYFKKNETGQRPDYLLIIDDDVLKYVQMANIGGRPGYYSVFGYQQRVENNIFEPETFPTILIFNSYSGPGQVGHDIILQNQLFPADQSYVVNILIPMTEDQNFGSPLAVIMNAYTGETTIMPYGCTCEYGVGCSENYGNNTIQACVEFIQGGLIHIPANLKDRFMTQIYLLNKTIPGFELVYSNQPVLSLQSILSQGDPTDIKIYKINYTEMKPWVDNGSPAW